MKYFYFWKWYYLAILGHLNIVLCSFYWTNTKYYCIKRFFILVTTLNDPVSMAVSFGNHKYKQKVTISYFLNKIFVCFYIWWMLIFLSSMSLSVCYSVIWWNINQVIFIWTKFHVFCSVNVRNWNFLLLVLYLKIKKYIAFTLSY